MGHPKAASLVLGYCLWGIREMFSPVDIYLLIVVMSWKISYRIYGTTIKISHECVTVTGLKVSAAFAAIGKYAADAGAGPMRRPAIIWPKNLFVLLYHRRQFAKVV